MKITLLSGAYKNAGDFLIVERCKELLTNCIKGADVYTIKRNESINKYVDEINKSDVVVLGGGPAYTKEVYPKIIPLVEDLKEIKVPFFAMALGWHGNNILPKTIYSEKFSVKTLQLLKRINSDGFSFGCRDYYSERVLRNSGFNNTTMTGCAAWYDTTCVYEQLRKVHDVKNILISDPAQPVNNKQFLDIVKYIQWRFPDANIKVVFHRGESGELKKALIKMGIPSVDIAYGLEGMYVYKSCDLHIGYRVHAHIFNLSQRQRSILIEEDSRGAGVNQALGLRNIAAYNIKTININKYLMMVFRKLNIIFDRSKYICNELEDYIQELEENDYEQIKWAVNRMQYYYEKMNQHILQLNKL